MSIIKIHIQNKGNECEVLQPGSDWERNRCKPAHKANKSNIAIGHMPFVIDEHLPNVSL